uniref:Seipin n=1 Tax=Taeniopygia guttata TaxID=59729 RepID=A0A674HMH5_TAEGU
MGILGPGILRKELLGRELWDFPHRFWGGGEDFGEGILGPGILRKELLGNELFGREFWASPTDFVVGGGGKSRNFGAYPEIPEFPWRAGVERNPPPALPSPLTSPLPSPLSPQLLPAHGAPLPPSAMAPGGLPPPPLLLWGAQLGRGARRALLRGALGLSLALLLLWAALFLYGSFYWAYLPAAALLRPLHLAFRSDCDSPGPELCSFPSANVSLLGEHREKVLLYGQVYRISLELELPESPVNRELGMFMVTLTCYGHGGRTLATASRSAMLHYRSRLLRALHTVAFSGLFLSGFAEQSQTLELELMARYREDPYTPTVGALVEIRSRRVQLYGARLRVHAHFSGLRYLLYHFPLTSAVLGVAGNWALLALLTLGGYLQWGRGQRPPRPAQVSYGWGRGWGGPPLPHPPTHLSPSPTCDRSGRATEEPPGRGRGQVRDGDFWGKFWGFLGGNFEDTFWGNFGGFWRRFWANLGRFGGDFGEDFREILENIWGGFWKIFWGGFEGDFGQIWEDLGKILGGISGRFWRIFGEDSGKYFGEDLKEILGRFGEDFAEDFREILRGFWRRFGEDFGKDFGEDLKEILGKFGKILGRNFAGILGGFWANLEGILGKILGRFKVLFFGFCFCPSPTPRSLSLSPKSGGARKRRSFRAQPRAKALALTGNRGVEQAMDWLVAHEDDPDSDSELPPGLGALPLGLGGPRQPPGPEDETQKLLSEAGQERERRRRGQELAKLREWRRDEERRRAAEERRRERAEEWAAR